MCDCDWVLTSPCGPVSDDVLQMGFTALEIAEMEEHKLQKKKKKPSREKDTQKDTLEKFGLCRKYLDEVVNLGYNSLHLAAEKGDVFHLRRLLTECSRGSKGQWEEPHSKTWYMGIVEGAESTIMHHYRVRAAKVRTNSSGASTSEEDMPPTSNWELEPDLRFNQNGDGPQNQDQDISIQWDKSKTLVHVHLAGKELRRGKTLVTKPKKTSSMTAMTEPKTMFHEEFTGVYRRDGQDDNRVVGFKKVHTEREALKQGFLDKLEDAGSVGLDDRASIVVGLSPSSPTTEPATFMAEAVFTPGSGITITDAHAIAAAIEAGSSGDNHYVTPTGGTTRYPIVSASARHSTQPPTMAPSFSPAVAAAVPMISIVLEGTRWRCLRACSRLTER